ncbi:MAG: hypothetical protein JW745_01400 [Sedimentisphaerales bacterium]|nr:hypothetical protein [Sedimentisphaerales bacterium]MBN2842071.1 hypothetical protein [Sedimentisphaerales bacterium]
MIRKKILYTRLAIIVVALSLVVWHMAGGVSHITGDSGMTLADRSNRFLDLSLEDLLKIEVVSGEGTLRHSWLEGYKGSLLVSGSDKIRVYASERISSQMMPGDNAVC